MCATRQCLEMIQICKAAGGIRREVGRCGCDFGGGGVRSLATRPPHQLHLSRRTAELTGLGTMIAVPQHMLEPYLPAVTRKLDFLYRHISPPADENVGIRCSARKDPLSATAVDRLFDRPPP